MPIIFLTFSAEALSISLIYSYFFMPHCHIVTEEILTLFFNAFYMLASKNVFKLNSQFNELHGSVDAKMFCGAT
jgi:hypothetical protein